MFEIPVHSVRYGSESHAAHGCAAERELQRYRRSELLIFAERSASMPISTDCRNRSLELRLRRRNSLHLLLCSRGII